MNIGKAKFSAAQIPYANYMKLFLCRSCMSCQYNFKT